MSERYGAPDEVQDLPYFLEQWLTDEIARAEHRLRSANGLGDPRYDAGRIQALRDVIDYIVVNENG